MFPKTEEQGLKEPHYSIAFPKMKRQKMSNHDKRMHPRLTISL